MWPNRENADEEPEWVKNERKQFGAYRDKNKDEKLDSAEVKDWIMPENFDHARAESKHLIFETDGDKVCTLLLVRFFSYLKVFSACQIHTLLVSLWNLLFIFFINLFFLIPEKVIVFLTFLGGSD